jgi:transketolase
VTIVANGIMVSRALEAAASLEHQSISARVLNLATLRPIDRDSILDAAAVTGAIVSVEEHSIHGGLGSAVAEVVSTGCPVPMRMLGVPDVFAPTGSTAWLLTHFGLTADGIHKAAIDVLAMKRKV